MISLLGSPQAVHQSPELQSKIHHLIELPMSAVILEGDYISFIEGTIFNPKQRYVVRFELDSPTEGGLFMMLEPGEWLIVSRINLERSSPGSKRYRELHDQLGRYSAHFFDVPETRPVMHLSFRGLENIE